MSGYVSETINPVVVAVQGHWPFLRYFIRRDGGNRSIGTRPFQRRSRHVRQNQIGSGKRYNLSIFKYLLGYFEFPFFDQGARITIGIRVTSHGNLV